MKINDQEQRLKRGLMGSIGGSVLIVASVLMRFPPDLAGVVLIIVGASVGGYSFATLRLLKRGEIVIREPTPEQDEKRKRAQVIVLVIVLITTAFLVANNLRQ